MLNLKNCTAVRFYGLRPRLPLMMGESQIFYKFGWGFATK